MFSLSLLVRKTGQTVVSFHPGVPLDNARDEVQLASLGPCKARGRIFRDGGGGGIV